MFPKYLNLLNDAIKKSKNGDYEDALAICNLLLSEFPDSYEIYETRSEILYRMDNYEEAFLDLEKVIELMPNEIAPLFRRGRWKLKLGNYSEAINDLTQVIELGSDYFIDSAYYLRAQAYFYCKEYERVLTDCEHVPNDFYIGPSFVSRERLISQSSKALMKQGRIGIKP